MAIIDLTLGLPAEVVVGPRTGTDKSITGRQRCTSGYPTEGMWSRAIAPSSSASRTPAHA